MHSMILVLAPLETALAAGLLSELDYMSADDRAVAMDLEAGLLAQAAANKNNRASEYPLGRLV